MITFAKKRQRPANDDGVFLFRHAYEYYMYFHRDEEVAKKYAVWYTKKNRFVQHGLWPDHPTAYTQFMRESCRQSNQKL